MSYRVLARAYRSETFDDVVGQEAISTTLRNAIDSGRVHHAYLFTGTRGVGKTSMARILAKALNCLSSDAPTAQPCCTCESCIAIAAGDDVDVIEIDAASNTGVDNIRELRGNAGFRPVRSRHKVYIIDEVHMLTTQAFNALLKTLEEPPSHVKFIMATTEPQKVLDTIKSRCQQFEFFPISVEKIGSHLQSVLDHEKVEADPVVVRRVARLARGSMRDGLSLLDKLISYDAKVLTAEMAEQVMPPPHDEMAAAVVTGIVQNDPAVALTELDSALQSGQTVERFCERMIEHVRTLMMINVCGAQSELIDIPAHMLATLTEHAAAFDAPTFVYMIGVLESLRAAAKRSGASRALAEAAVVRLAMAQRFTDVTQLIERLDGAPALDVHGADQTPGDRAKKKVDAGTRREASVADILGEGARREDAPAGDGPPDAPGSEPVHGHADVSQNGSAAASPRPRTAQQTPSIPSSRSTESSDAGHAVSSGVWQRVAQDPAVERVRDAVDGTLFDVCPIARSGRSAEGDSPTSGPGHSGPGQ